MTPEERTQFLESHRLAILGVERKDAPPHLSPVYYVVEGDDLLVSVTKTRAKTALIRKSGRLSRCVLGEQFPFPYLRIDGRGPSEDERAGEVMIRMGEKMTGAPIADSARPGIEDRATREQRVVLRVTPESYYP